MSTAAAEGSCASCGKDGAVSRCTVCRRVFYCGRPCQLKHWKKHKKTCEKPVPLSSVIAKLYQAQLDHDWEAMIKYEKPYMEDLMTGKDDSIRQEVLRMFSAAHDAMLERTGESKYRLAAIELIRRRVEIHRKMGEFSTQGRLLVKLAMYYIMIPDMKEAEKAAMEAREIAASTHSLYLDSASYTALGSMYLMPEYGDTDGDGTAKGVEMLRNAVLAAFLEGTNPSHELETMRLFVVAILDKTDTPDEAVEVVERFREVAVEQSRTKGRLSFYEVEGLSLHVRVCEVVVHSTLQACCNWRTHAANGARSVPVCILAYGMPACCGILQPASVLWYFTTSQRAVVFYNQSLNHAHFHRHATSPRSLRQRSTSCSTFYMGLRRIAAWLWRFSVC